MYNITSCLSLYVLLGVLVMIYHSVLWGCGWTGRGSTRSWVSSFECGFSSHRLAEDYFSCTYFTLLVFFVIFDLEVSLLLNMPLQGQLFKNLLFYFLFLLLVALGFCVEVWKGYAKWGY